MAERNYNRDRNRPYDEEFDESRSGREYGSRWRSEGDYSQYGNRGYGGGYGRNYGRSQGDFGGGSGRNINRDRGGMGSDYGSSGYGRRYGGGGYGSQNRFGSGLDTDLGYYGRDFSDYDFDYEDDFDNEPMGWSYTEVWYIPGPYSGMGPQGYQRSDDRIREDVNERLTLHGQLDARNIQVEVNNGEVTLTGTVNNRQAKRMAEDVADSVSGVQDIHNQLRVQNQTQDFQQQNRQQEQRQGQQQQQQQQQQQNREGQRQQR